MESENQSNTTLMTLKIVKKKIALIVNGPIKIRKIILHYEKGELKFNYEDTDYYINNNKKYNKEEILSIIKNS